MTVLLFYLLICLVLVLRVLTRFELDYNNVIRNQKYVNKRKKCRHDWHADKSDTDFQGAEHNWHQEFLI